MSLLSIRPRPVPFHLCHPSAPLKYLGVDVLIPFHDVNGKKVSPESVAEAQRHFLASQVFCTPTKHDELYLKEPKYIILPTWDNKSVREQTSGGWIVTDFIKRVRFFQYRVCEIMRRPLKNCEWDEVSPSVSAFLLDVLRKRYGMNFDHGN